MDRWLVLQNDLNKGTIFWGRPVGNSLEFMPLDNSLNRDVIMCHRYYCTVTYHLHNDDKRTFSLLTPWSIAQRIKWVMQHESGCPSPSRIQKDCQLATKYMVMVYCNNGKIVPGLADRNIIRLDKSGSNMWGGVWIKKYSHISSPWLYHLDVQALIKKTKQIMEGFRIDRDVACNLGLTP